MQEDGVRRSCIGTTVEYSLIDGDAEIVHISRVHESKLGDNTKLVRDVASEGGCHHWRFNKPAMDLSSWQAKDTEVVWHFLVQKIRKP